MNRRLLLHFCISFTFFLFQENIGPGEKKVKTKPASKFGLLKRLSKAVLGHKDAAVKAIPTKSNDNIATNKLTYGCREQAANEVKSKSVAVEDKTNNDKNNSGKSGGCSDAILAKPTEEQCDNDVKNLADADVSKLSLDLGITALLDEIKDLDAVTSDDNAGDAPECVELPPARPAVPFRRRNALPVRAKTSSSSLVPRVPARVTLPQSKKEQHTSQHHAGASNFYANRQTSDALRASHKETLLATRSVFGLSQKSNTFGRPASTTANNENTSTHAEPNGRRVKPKISLFPTLPKASSTTTDTAVQAISYKHMTSQDTKQEARLARPALKDVQNQARNRFGFSRAPTSTNTSAVPTVGNATKAQSLKLYTKR